MLKLVFVLSKISILGLHISLGVFLKFYQLLLSECAEFDKKIAYKLAEDSSDLGDSRLDELFKKLREAKQHEAAAAAYFTKAKSAEEYACYAANWMAIKNQMDNPNPLISQLLEHSHMLKQKAEKEVSYRTHFFTHVNKYSVTYKKSVHISSSALYILFRLTLLHKLNQSASSQEIPGKSIAPLKISFKSNSFFGSQINICLNPFTALSLF